MNGTLANRSGRRQLGLPQLMLLVLLAFGVAGMHTFGHQLGVADGSPSAIEHASHGMALVHDGLVESTPVQLADSSTDHGMDLHVFTVCLAVLGAVAVVVSLALARHRRWDVVACPRAGVPAAARGRAPPDHRVGLTVAVVAVLRM